MRQYQQAQVIHLTQDSLDFGLGWFDNKRREWCNQQFIVLLMSQEKIFLKDTVNLKNTYFFLQAMFTNQKHLII